MRGRMVFVLAFVACGSPTPRDAPVAETCRLRIPAHAPSPPSAAASIALPPTRIISHVELRLAHVKSELEAKIPERVAEERGAGIGALGHLNYVADRGPITVVVENDSLVVRTDVRAHAEACRDGQCYASCNPIARATAVVPLHLGPDWRFPPSKVTAAFVKGCEVRALGGLVKIDVTPTIQARLAPTLRVIEQRIDQQLPPLKPQAERIWSELGKARALPLGGCVIVDPQGIVQGPVSGTADTVRVRFALLASPEIRSRCGTPPVAKPLPPLAQDPSMPAEDDVALGLVGPLATATTAFRDVAPFDAGGARARIADARGLVAELRGEVCGDVELRSPSLGWQPDGKALQLASATLANEEDVKTASLDPAKIARALEGAKLPPPLPIEGLKELLPQLGSALSDPSVEVQVKISAVAPLDARVRNDDIVARVRIRASVDLREK